MWEDNGVGEIETRTIKQIVIVKDEVVTGHFKRDSGAGHSLVVSSNYRFRKKVIYQFNHFRFKDPNY